MGNKGKNKCKRGAHSAITEEQPWFKSRKDKKKAKNKMAKKSRKKNR